MVVFNRFKNTQKQPQKPAPKQPKIWVKPEGGYYPQYKDMFDATHLLIAGTTGSGKSTLLNGILYTAVTAYAPNEVGFVLVDTKYVELSPWKHLPHTYEFIKHAQDVPSMLDDVIFHMECEYKRMEEQGIRKSRSKHLYVVIDELADLMCSPYAKEIKAKLQVVLQKGRAANIHIIACTQAPSRKVIPAELVLNFTNRVALRCLSSIESRQILTVGGAEKIKGFGKGKYLSPKDGIVDVSIPLIEEDKINKRILFWMAQKD